MNYYFKFSDNNTRIGSSANSMLSRVLSKFFEKETIVNQVAEWLVEFNPDYNCVEREVGLNQEGKPIYWAPLKKEYGLWSDCPLNLDDYEKFFPEPITNEIFEKAWNPE